jgi:uncharacterized SAM-binding protein YcdF (DUF218 family)
MAHFFRSTLPFVLIPPAGLIWWIMIGAVVMRRRRRLGRWIVGTGFALLYALGTPVVGGQLIGSLEAVHPLPPNAEQPGAIIILGADGERTPDPLVKAEPGPLSLQRLAGAALIVRENKLPVLITGARVGIGQPAVANLMADLFTQAFGLPVEWRETKAENTCENARYSAEILRKAGINSALVVTHAWHMPRAILAFRQAGFDMVPAPLHGDAMEIRGISDFLPHASAWMRSFYALHEWIGLLAYRAGACPAMPSSAPSAAPSPSPSPSPPPGAPPP